MKLFIIVALFATITSASPIFKRDLSSNNSSTNSSFNDLCSISYVRDSLPLNGTLLGIEMIPTSVEVNVAESSNYSYCNISVSYAHTGKNDTVVLNYALPDPSNFENRFYVAGGGGYSLSSSSTSGLSYGAAGGCTDAGYDAFYTSYDEVVLFGNGSINWDATYMFSYQGLGEMTTIGKFLTSVLYGMSDDEKLYTYFEGCSDGGREGMSQIQRYGELYDGVAVGAPAFRYAQQQVNHVYPAMVEKDLNYFPPPCELSKIVNATIAACDSLDGRIDGVISRTDLCMLKFNLSSIIGEPYYCGAQNSTSLGFGFSKRAEGSTTSYQPEQNGTVTAEGVAVAQAIYKGLQSSAGQRAYLSWQIGSELSDGETKYSEDSESWELNIPYTGGEYVTKFIQLLNIDNLSSLDNITYDTLVDWMSTGYYRYLDSLQTTIPDLTSFYSNGGKLLHYHGESDPSVPAASSVHYWQSVRSIMYREMSFNESLTALDNWYQFYLVPGAAHCNTNSLQPGPYPESNMETIIDWVEKDRKPSGLNSTVSSGDYEGESQLLCKWPLRPFWKSNSSYDCVYDQMSYDSWTYTFDAFKVPIY